MGSVSSGRIRANTARDVPVRGRIGGIDVQFVRSAEMTELAHRVWQQHVPDPAEPARCARCGHPYPCLSRICVLDYLARAGEVVPFRPAAGTPAPLGDGIEPEPVSAG